MKDIKVKETSDASQKEKLKKQSKTNLNIFKDKPLEISGIVIAVLALFLTIWQGYETRKFNKLSLKPKLVVWVWNYYDTGGMVMKIKNEGVGPAIIDDISLDIKNRDFYKVSELNGHFWEKIFNDEHIPDSLIANSIQHSYLNAGGYLPAGEEIVLFEFLGDKEHVINHNKIIDFIRRFSSLEITYHSVYDDKDLTKTLFEQRKTH